MRPDADAHDLVRTVDGYGADQVALEKAEAEYRARREEAKVWRRRRDEENRQVLEARARQARTYSEDIASRVEGAMKNEEEARIAELRRVKEAERVQIEEKKRIEEDRQLIEKRREAEKRKKEERKKREEEKRKEEEGRQKRRKVVEEATAQAREEKRRRDEQRELKARENAEEHELFLVKEQLAKRSAEAEKARMARAEKDWQKLQEKESAEGVPMGAPAFSYRSREADLSREACESLGNMRDQWNEATLKKGHWFDYYLCILEPVNSMQMVVFEQLKMAGLLCSRYSAA